LARLCHRRSAALADARELLAPPVAAMEEAEAEAAEIGKEWSQPSGKGSACGGGCLGCGAVRLCLCAAAGAALCLGLAWLLSGGSPAAVEGLVRTPSFEGVVEAERPYFVHHVGGICFGRRRIETDPEVGELVFELSAPGTARPWKGIGELYLLVFDDEPQHWGLASNMWQASMWNKLADLSNFCALVTRLHNFTGSLPRGHRMNDKVHVSLRIKETVTRQWRVALLGVDWRPDAELARSLRFRVLGREGLSGWSGGRSSGPETGRCPPQNWEAAKERIWDLFAPSGASPQPQQPQLRFVQWRPPGLERCSRQ